MTAPQITSGPQGAIAAEPTELIRNGGFENGGPGWVPNFAEGAINASPLAHSGQNVFVADSVDVPRSEFSAFAQGTLTQMVATITGQHYTLDFFLATDQVTEETSATVFWNGTSVTTISDQTASSVPNYTEYTFDVVGGPGSSSQLEFGFANNPTDNTVAFNSIAAWYLDDVSVTTQFQTASGAISFTDADFNDTHTVSVEQNTNIGTFTATLVNDSTDGGTGTVDWAFTVSDAALKFLAAGQTETETFTVDVTDSQNQTATQDVSITLTGVNDAPTFIGGTTTGFVGEQLFVTNADPTKVTDGTTGTLNFTDPDLIDTHHTAQASYVANSAVWLAGDASPIPAQTLSDLAGAMQAVVTADSTNGATGQVTWSVNIPDRDLDFLQQGQVLTTTYNVAVADGHGGTATQAVDVTFVGTEDLPQVTSGALTGTVTARAPSLISNGGFEDSGPGWTQNMVQGEINASPQSHSGRNVFVTRCRGRTSFRVQRFRARNVDARRSRRGPVCIIRSTFSLRPIRSRRRRLPRYFGTAPASPQYRTEPPVPSLTTPNTPLMWSAVPDRARSSNSVLPITRRITLSASIPSPHGISTMSV